MRNLWKEGCDDHLELLSIMKRGLRLQNDTAMQPHQVARLVAEVFSRQVFEDGFVHCDP